MERGDIFEGQPGGQDEPVGALEHVVGGGVEGSKARGG